MSTSKPSYVSSSGSIGERPLALRVTDTVSDYGAIAYLFFQTLFSPFINPSSWANPSQVSSATRPGGSGSTSGSSWGSGGGGGGGGGGGNTGGGPRGGGGGFMSMGDLRGGGTVDGCRATCG